MTVAADGRSPSMQKITAGPGFNRWLIPPAALGIHMCIGQVYATSVYRNPLRDHFEGGFLSDLLGAETSIAVIFSVAIVMLGLSAALFGTWVDRNGPRKAILASTACWVSGFVIGAIGIFTGQLWLVYLGYGFIGGIGLGIGYIAPVSTLMKWFPDRPGLGTGMAIMGFGVGAMIATPLSSFLMNLYSGDDDVSGIHVAYLFLTLAAIYCVMMLFAAWIVRVPAPGWKPEGFDPDKQKKKSMVSEGNVRVNTAMKTKQFWLLWIILFVNVTAGIGILEQANNFVQDFFRGDDGETLWSTEAAVAAGAGFVAFTSLTNTLGRFIWASTSDKIGRKPMYMIYLGLGALLYFTLATWGNLHIALFIVLTGFILSFYGGGFATIPAYLRDLFGTLQVGAIHGRLLTAWSCAGIAGPLIVNGVLDAQGGGAGDTATADSYRPALYIMVALLVIGFIANMLVNAVDEKHHVESEEQPAEHQDKAAAEQEGASDRQAQAEQPEEEAEVEPASKPAVPVPVAWIVVAIPILYGLTYQFINGAQLFTA
ncbi:OFA family MFS transporter [Nesterenkonia alba]|uniref:OFA family MFS transporter n=1 Tax=Nesterenkonia alba TaxID=515814 RepID=UPI001FE00949|nr:OFA family MFS transporter [Nesterenkonia alba]